MALQIPSFQASSLQKCEDPFCCFEPSSLWYLFTVAVGNKHVYNPNLKYSNSWEESFDGIFH